MAQPPRGLSDHHRNRYPQLLQAGVWAGFATIGSGVAAVTVSNAVIAASMGIKLTAFPTSFGAIGSAQGALCVRSVNPGVAFVVGNMTAVTYPWDTNVYWEIVRLT